MNNYIKPQQAYNEWAGQYDTNENKTRDLEGAALREILSEIPFRRVLEIGCGTGKNTVWLMEKADHITAVDLSEEMLAKAATKTDPGKVTLQRADINSAWTFADDLYDLVGFSLVLEHIENLDLIFKKAAGALKSGGYVYVGELHPFKQYSGSKARFGSAEGERVVECFNHHISDFTSAAENHGLVLNSVDEYFDNNDRSNIPRILTLLFQKS